MNGVDGSKVSRCRGYRGAESSDFLEPFQSPAVVAAVVEVKSDFFALFVCSIFPKHVPPAALQLLLQQRAAILEEERNQRRNNKKNTLDLKSVIVLRE